VVTPPSLEIRGGGGQGFPSITRNVSGRVVKRWSRGEVGGKTLRRVSSEGGVVVARVFPQNVGRRGGQEIITPPSLEM